jgi:hypothetical protein
MPCIANPRAVLLRRWAQVRVDGFPWGNAMRVRWLLMAALLSLCACAAIDLKRSLSAEHLAHIKNVGVVALLGDSLNGVLIGTTALNSKRFSASVADWDIDGYVVARSLAILKENDRFATSALQHPGLGQEQLRADHARLVWELAQRQGYDTVVSVWPSVSENFPFFKPGYGFYDNSILGLTHRCIYAAYTVEIYDVASHNRIAWEWGGDAPCRMGSDGGLVFKERFDDYTDAEKRLMRQGVEARISETLRVALGKLSLARAAGKAL